MVNGKCFHLIMYVYLTSFRRKLSNSLIDLRRSHEEFIITSKSIDWDGNSLLINGSATEKPLIYYIEYSFDIMYYLYVYEKTIQLRSKQLYLNLRDTNTKTTNTTITTYLKTIPIAQNVYDLITDVLLNSNFLDDKIEKVRN